MNGQLGNNVLWGVTDMDTLIDVDEELRLIGIRIAAQENWLKGYYTHSHAAGPDELKYATYLHAELLLNRKVEAEYVKLKSLDDECVRPSDLPCRPLC